MLSLLELMGQSLDHTDWKLFLNGKGFMDHGKKHAMYSVMTLQEVMKSNALLEDMSSQNTELVAFTRAIKLS
jgi:hypothetical protein